MLEEAGKRIWEILSKLLQGLRPLKQEPDWPSEAQLREEAKRYE